jgi:hypothetical protein
MIHVSDISKSWIGKTSKNMIDIVSTTMPYVITLSNIWAMVNTHYMVDGHPIHNKDPYNGYYNPYKPLDD